MLDTTFYQYDLGLEPMTLILGLELGITNVSVSIQEKSRQT